MKKSYWLIGLIAGIVFGLLLVYAHEHVREFGRIFNINYDGVHAPFLFKLYLTSIQQLYQIAFMPFFFLGILTMFIQFYLPPITYGILGAFLGWLYGKIKNRNKIN